MTKTSSHFFRVALLLSTLMLLATTLAACTEDDDPAEVAVAVKLVLTNVSAPGSITTSAGAADVTLSPGVWIVHDDTFKLFEVGQALQFEGLEALAEDGDPATLLATLNEVDGVQAAGILGALNMSYETAPIAPMTDAIASFSTTENLRLSVAVMFAESNDVLLASDPNGIALAELVGDTASTIEMSLYDAGTEANEEPAVGAHQPMRQMGPNTGPSTTDAVQRIEGMDASGFAYPDPSAFVTLTLESTP